METAQIHTAATKIGLVSKNTPICCATISCGQKMSFSQKVTPPSPNDSKRPLLSKSAA